MGNLYATLTFTNADDISLTLALDFTNKLKERGLEIIPPPSYHSERTIFISKTQSYITDKPAEDILESINSNPLNTIKACSVLVIQHRNYRPGNSKTLKVTYETPQKVNEVLTKGIHVCGLHHAPDQIKKELFIPITQCFKCFSYKHSSTDCSEKDALCGNCARTHHFSTCKATKFQCAQCGGEHKAISLKCPIRKQVLEDLKSGALSKPQGGGNPGLNNQVTLPAIIPPTNQWFNNNPKEFPSLNTTRHTQFTSNPLTNPLPPPPHSPDPKPQRIKRKRQSINTHTNDTTSQDNNTQINKLTPLDKANIQMQVYNEILKKLIMKDPHFEQYALLHNDFLVQKDIEPVDVCRMKSLLNQPSLPTPPNPLHPTTLPDPTLHKSSQSSNPPQSSSSSPEEEAVMPFSLSNTPVIQTPQENNITPPHSPSTNDNTESGKRVTFSGIEEILDPTPETPKNTPLTPITPKIPTPIPETPKTPYCTPEMLIIPPFQHHPKTPQNHPSQAIDLKTLLLNDFFEQHNIELGSELHQSLISKHNLS